MTEQMNNATHELGFVGVYLCQYAAAYNWNENEGTRKHLLEELLRMADRVKNAAEIIRKEMK